MGGEIGCRSLAAAAVAVLGLGWALAAPAQRLNPPATPAPVIAPGTGDQGDNTVAKLPAHESIVPQVAFRQNTAPPPSADPLIAGHDLDVGTFYYHRGDWVGALSRFQDAIYNDPHAPEAYCRAGDTEFKLKHGLRAQDDWRRCLQVAGEGKWAAYARKALAKHKGRPQS
ncbi:MAG TPA: hypothetical protein VNF74_03215 [Terriglobales bacterium]|nr:hypothetical protein [Terriglobales bacterium]